MMSTTLGALRAGHQGAAYARGFACDRCHGEFAMNSERVVHCGSCEVDFCDGCTAQMAATLECDTGHPLAPKYAADLAGESAAYSAGYTCNTCGSTLAAFPVRHCSACSFDMCPACVGARLGYPAAPTATAPVGPITPFGAGPRVHTFGGTARRAVLHHTPGDEPCCDE